MREKESLTSETPIAGHWTPCKIKKLKFEKKFITNYNGSKNPFDAGFLEEIL